jgi:hypothetical protein
MSPVGVHYFKKRLKPLDLLERYVKVFSVLFHLCLVDSPVLLKWINFFSKLGISSIFIMLPQIFFWGGEHIVAASSVRPCVYPSVHNFARANKTLWEASLPRGDVHIISRFWSDDYSQSYGPLKFFINFKYIVQFLSGLFLSN